MPRGKKKVESDTETESEDDFLNDDSSDEDSSDLDLGSDDEGSDDEDSSASGSDEEEEDEEEEMNTQPYFSNFSLAPQTSGFGATQFLQQPQFVQQSQQGQFLQQPQFQQQPQQQFQPQQFQQQQSSFLAQSQNRPLQLQSQPQTSFFTQPQTSFLTQPQQLQQPQTSFLTQPQTSFLTQPQQLQQPQTSFLAQPQLQPQQLQQPQTSFLTQPQQLQQPQTSFLTQPGSATPTQSQLQQAQQVGLRTPTSLLTTPLTQTFQLQQPQTSFLTSQPQFQQPQTSFLTQQPQQSSFLTQSFQLQQTQQPGSATPTSVQAQQVQAQQVQQVQQPKPTPDLVTLLTKYDFKPYNIEFRLWNTIPKKLIIKFPKDLFNDYKKYFEAYQGEFHPDYIKEDKSSAWVFSSSRQNDLEELIKNILTRALPAPSQLAVPPAVSINMQAGLNLGSTTPSAASRIVAEPNVTPVTKSVEASQIVAAGPKTPPAPAMAPTSAPSAVVQNLNLTSTGMPNITTPQLKVPTETLISLAQRAQAQYSVLKQDLGEIEERYKRRQAYYNILLANPALNRSPQVKEYADTLSRMKVNIEFDNTKYGDHEIKVLESYLGK